MIAAVAVPVRFGDVGSDGGRRVAAAAAVAEFC